MSRSRFTAADSCCRAPGEVRFVFSSRASRKAPSLAAIVPRNYCSEKNVKPAKTRSQKRIAPIPRAKKCHRAKYHKTESHQRDYPNRKRTRRDNSSSVKQQPHSGNGLHFAEVHHHSGEESTRQNRWSETVGEPTRRSREQRRAGSTANLEGATYGRQSLRRPMQ